MIASRVAVPSVRKITSRPRSEAWRAVVSQHMCVMKPMRIFIPTVPASIFCSRLLHSGGLGAEAPLMCVDPELTRADPRVQALAAEVAARGPVVHWAVPWVDHVPHCAKKISVRK